MRSIARIILLRIFSIFLREPGCAIIFSFKLDVVEGLEPSNSRDIFYKGFVNVLP